MKATRELWKMSARRAPFDCIHGTCPDKSLACQTRALTLTGIVLKNNGLKVPTALACPRV